MRLPLKTKLNQLLGNRLLQHQLFWLGTYLAFLQHFSLSPSPASIDLIFTAWFLVPLMPMVYVSLKWAFPVFFEKGRYLPYLFSLGLIVATGLLLHNVVFEYLAPAVMPGFYIISYSNYPELIRLYAIVLAIATLLKLSRSWFMLDQMRQAQTAAELTALRAQINPHFLFNSLNSIYSLALSRHADAPEVVLKLSDMLRFAVYDSNKPQVPLDREWGAISQYADLQKIRIDEPEKVAYHLKGDLDGWQIAPMLLLTLAENAFKHADLSKVKGFVRIDLAIDGKKCVFEARNSCQADQQLLQWPEQTGGVGLENTKARLNLLYPDRHQLQIRQMPEQFEVKLILEQ